MDIGFLAVLLGGVLTLLSPCGALLLPSFFAYAFRDPARLMLRTGVFYAGLCLTLVPLGAGSALVSTLFYGHRDVLITVAGGLIIAFGAAQVLGLGFTWGTPTRLQARFAGRTGLLSVFGLGAVYGFAGFCSGPILGAVLTVAATGTPLRGMLLLAVYALGMALPLFFLALLWDRFDLGRRRWLRGRAIGTGRFRVHTTSLLSGLLFIGVGVLFIVYDGTASLALLPGVDRLSGAADRAQGPLSLLDGRTDLVAVGAVSALVLLVLAARWLSGRRRTAAVGRDDAAGTSGAGRIDDASDGTGQGERDHVG